MGWWKESEDELAKAGKETCDEASHPAPKNCYWCNFTTRRWERGWCPGGGAGAGAGQSAGTLGGLAQLGQDFGAEGLSNIFGPSTIDYRSRYTPMLPTSDTQRAQDFRREWDMYSFGMDPRKRVMR